MKVMVTGSRGFIGRHLTRKLKQAGHRVLEFDYSLGSDITRPAIPDDLDVIVHLAALLKTESDKLVNYLFSVNVIGTMRLLEAAIENRIPRLVFASSAAVYDCLNVYGASKLAGEAYCRSVANKVDVKILRFFNVYGPGQFANGGALIPKTIDAVFTRQPIVVNGDGSHTRDYIYVDDIVTILLDSINRETKLPSNTPLDIGTGISSTTNQVISTILDSYKTVIGQDAHSALEKIGLDGRRETVYSNAKVEQPVLSILQEPISLKDGITKTIQYWKDQVLIGRD